MSLSVAAVARQVDVFDLSTRVYGANIPTIMLSEKVAAGILAEVWPMGKRLLRHITRRFTR